MSAPIKVFKARLIRTMNPNRPTATHVAVRDGRILGVGTEADLAGWGELAIDETFADKVLAPGFVEAHAHSWEGAAWADLFVGYFKRTAPDGSEAGGQTSIPEVVEALKAREAAMSDPDEALVAWGFDPIYFDGARMVAADLDAVSTTRPIILAHASGHILNCNSWVLKKAGIDRATNVEGVMKDDAGEPTGEMQEMAAMFMARQAAGAVKEIGMATVEDYRRYAASATNAGVTTIADLGSRLGDKELAILETVTADPDYPLRLVPALYSLAWPLDEGLARARELKSKGNAKLYPHLVKVMTDGSIQGFTGRLRWPGYYNGAPNGIWNAPPEQLSKQMIEYHKAGCLVHVHVNGDQATQLAIEAFQQALDEAPRRDHRHTLQHCQMADAAQFRRMAEIGLCANLFANHVYYWGDQHYALTMGPDRAERMDACATALREGVNLSIHCDVPVTPLAPLFTAWCAANRITATGRLLGAEERISAEDALHAITLGAAWQLKLDHLVGSVEVGKFADFAVLDEDPLAADPMKLKDISVWGVIHGGEPRQSAKSAAAAA